MARNMAVSSGRRMLNILLKNPAEIRCMNYSGSGWGSGSGKGGGTGGSIRDAGGSFGKKEAAAEEEYFRRQQAEQLAALKEHIKTEIEHHEEQVKRHQELVQRHKKKLEEVAIEPKKK